MRKLLLAIPLLASALLAAPDDLILSQAKNPGPGNIQRNVAPTAFGFLTFDTNKVPTSPSDLLYSSGSLSIGESTNSAYRLYIRHTADLTKTRAINVEFNPTLVANNATSFRGLAVSQTINTAGFDATGTSYALNMGIGVNGSGGTASDLQGIRGSVRNDTSAAVTQAIGVSSGLFVNSSANMTTGYNFYGDATSGSSGLIPTYYGAYIASPAAGFGATLAAAYSAPWNSAANRYGLYFPGTVAHYLGGNLGVADGFTLSSAGSIDFTAGGTDENITLTPSGTGNVETPAWVIVNAANTAGMLVITSTGQPFFELYDGDGGTDLKRWSIRASSSTTTTNSFLQIQSRTDANSFTKTLIATDREGNVTTGGNISPAGAVIGSVQSLSGAGAVNVTQLTTELTSTGALQAITLADGTAGQIKTIVHGVDGGSMVLTPTTKTGYTTITFTNAGDAVTLQFFTTRGWIIIGIFGAIAA